MEGTRRVSLKAPRNVLNEPHGVHMEGTRRVTLKARVPGCTYIYITADTNDHSARDVLGANNDRVFKA